MAEEGARDTEGNWKATANGRNFNDVSVNVAMISGSRDVTRVAMVLGRMKGIVFLVDWLFNDGSWLMPCRCCRPPSATKEMILPYRDADDVRRRWIFFYFFCGSACGHHYFDV